MDWLTTIISLIVGLVLRLGVPIVITILVISILHRLDEHWQAEAKAEASAALIFATADGKYVWDVASCTPEKRAKCLAANSNEPCWQIVRQPDGHLSEGCITCEVFQNAPVPGTAPAHATA